MGAVAAVVILATLTAASDAAVQSKSEAIRPEVSDLRALVHQGLAGSATFQKLAGQLRDSGMLVYVRFGTCAGGAPACLLMAAGHRQPRIVVVRLERYGHSTTELIALLAHELQHACEVAAAPWVVDAESLARLYEQRGWNGGAGFETAAARAVTFRVSAELLK